MGQPNLTHRVVAMGETRTAQATFGAHWDERNSINEINKTNLP